MFISNLQEKHMKYNNPDLHFNRAEALGYLQDYSGAMKELDIVNNIDPNQGAFDQITKYINQLNKINDLIINKVQNISIILGKTETKKISSHAKFNSKIFFPTKW